MSAELGEYFSYLASLEHPTLLGTATDPVVAMKRIAETLRKRQHRLENRKDAEVFQIKEWPKIFAALGTLAEGAHWNELLKRTSLEPTRLEKILEVMCERGLVRKDLESRRYFALSNHLVFPGMDDKSQFKTFFLGALNDLARSAERDFGSTEKLFLSSSFSVDRQVLPQLKEELRELFMRYVDQAENSRGDSIANLVVGLAPL